MGPMSDVSTLNLEPGEVVGGYTLVSRLGSGAMGSVWRVTDGGGQSYAMKILRDSLADDSSPDPSGAYGNGRLSGGDPHAAQDPDLKAHVTPRERLRREALALRKINHPGVCGIVDMELDDSLAFIVTELIEGRNLKDDVAANGRYVGEDLERLARKLIDAVKAVHAAGIVHRDIKPTNVMVSVSGPVLVDFGIAMGEGESHVTRTGLVMGTPGFIAPEIIDGAESDEATDWWSVASVLAFAATGAPVFGTKPMMAVLERAAAGNANLTGLPAGTMAAFRSALNPDRAQRCTPDQLLAAITADAMRNNSLFTGAGAATTTFVNAPDHMDGHSGAMLPFADARDNPRLAWRNGGDAGNERTRILPDDARTTAVLPDAPQSAERTVVLSGATTPMPMPTLAPPGTPDGQNGWAPAGAQAEFPNGAARPALQRVIAQTAQAAPTEALEQSAPDMPNPADIRRKAYVERGVLPLLMLALPVGLIAAIAPLAAAGAIALLAWLLLTLGCSMASQLEREGKRGGERKSTDSLLRAASLPWHLLKAFLLMLPRLLIALLVAIAGTALAAIALHLPTFTYPWSVGGWTIPLRLLDGISSSSCGLAVGGCTAIGWLIAVFCPQSSVIRLGAGVLRGLGKLQGGDLIASDELPDHTDKQGGRGPALFVVWLVVCLPPCIAMLLGLPILWLPLQ